MPDLNASCKEKWCELRKPFLPGSRHKLYNLNRILNLLFSPNGAGEFQ
jgi:hypothetical protein